MELWVHTILFLIFLLYQKSRGAADDGGFIFGLCAWIIVVIGNCL